MSAVRKAREELYARMLAGWSGEDLSMLAALLHRLNQSMDEYARSVQAGRVPQVREDGPEEG
jgi:hypothetical protein